MSDHIDSAADAAKEGNGMSGKGVPVRCVAITVQPPAGAVRGPIFMRLVDDLASSRVHEIAYLPIIDTEAIRGDDGLYRDYAYRSVLPEQKRPAGHTCLGTELVVVGTGEDGERRVEVLDWPVSAPARIENREYPASQAHWNGLLSEISAASARAGYSPQLTVDDLGMREAQPDEILAWVDDLTCRVGLDTEAAMGHAKAYVKETEQIMRSLQETFTSELHEGGQGMKLR